jgi:hypothetical protein
MAQLSWRCKSDEEWATFFLALDIPFCYYPGMIDLPRTFVLSAFWLPDQETWVQAVLRPPAPGVARQAMHLADETGYAVALFFGAGAATATASAYVYAPHALQTGLVATGMMWTECPTCTRVALAEQGRLVCLPCACVHAPHDDNQVGHDTARLRRAYAQARQTRTNPPMVPCPVGVDVSSPQALLASCAPRSHPARR